LIAFEDVPVLTIAPPAAGGIAASAPLSLAFLAQPQGAAAPSLAFSLNVSSAFALDVSVSPSASAPGSLVFSGALDFVSANLALGMTNVGPVSIGLLQALANLALPLAAAALNGALAAGFPLPPIEGVAFSNATALALEDGYARFAADFTFSP
jgi:LBP / BPI / CETP family, C-terminal domain